MSRSTARDDQPVSQPVMAKPMKTLELHDPMIQVLIIHILNSFIQQGSSNIMHLAVIQFELHNCIERDITR